MAVSLALSVAEPSWSREPQILSCCALSEQGRVGGGDPFPLARLHTASEPPAAG